MKQAIGLGVLTWDGVERRTNRYGSVVLVTAPYGGKDDVCTRELSLTLLGQLVGERVRLTAHVVQARDSGHIGDMFLGVAPSTPEVGETIELGVGVLGLGDGFDGTPSIELMPGDGRDELWMDPRVLYRLHDQTVELFAEVTTDDCTTVEPFDEAEPDGAVSTGEVDGDGQALQMKGTPENVPLRVCPQPVSLGDGMFVIDGTPEKGKRFAVTPGSNKSN